MAGLGIVLGRQMTHLEGDDNELSEFNEKVTK